MSPAMCQKLRVAEWVNPGILRAYRGKRPGLYLASAKKIARERWDAEPTAFNCQICRLLTGK